MRRHDWKVRFSADTENVLDYISPGYPDFVSKSLRESFASAPSRFFNEEGLIDGEIAVNIVMETAGTLVENGMIPDTEALLLIQDVRSFLDVPRVRDLTLELKK